MMTLQRFLSYFLLTVSVSVLTVCLSCSSHSLKIVLLQQNREHLSQHLSSSVVMQNLTVGYVGIG
jgi:hypothetical protein